MNSSFIYDIPTKVYFGENQLSNLSKELKKYGTRVLMVYGGGSIKKIGLYDKVVKELSDNGLELFELSGIEPNPRIESVRKGAELCKLNQVDVVLAVGGGSTIDASKFIAAGALVDFDPWLFLEKKEKIEKALPIVTILTIAATGSEMDNGGVISNLATNDKKDVGSYVLNPKVSFLDPTNTYSVSSYQTACGSADIISHILEVYFTMEDDLYMLDTFMEGMLKTVIKYAPIAMEQPNNYEARANLMWCASWAINGFVAGGKKHSWSCHPIEHQLSAYYDITHGLGLAIITPKWLQYCLNDATVDKYYQFGVNVFAIDHTMNKYLVANLAIEKLSEFFYQTLKLNSRLSELNIDDQNFDVMSQKAMKGKEVIKGFVDLRPADIKKIYELSL